MYTLGINAAFHDSAACLVRDGEVLAAAEEERFTGIKHGKRPTPFTTYELPFHAIDYCLSQAGIDLQAVDHIGYSFDPHLLMAGLTDDETITLPLEPSASSQQNVDGSPWEPLFLSSIVNAPRHLKGGFPHHLQSRFLESSQQPRYTWTFLDHHLCHAASAFLPSPFEDAAVMTIDGRGEKATTSYWRGSGASLEQLGQVQFPHSLGLLYEAVTTHLGFLHSSDEYKVMALASFGQPRYAGELRRAIRVFEDGNYTIERIDLTQVSGPKRGRGAAFEQSHYDLARSTQVVLEEVVIELARWLRAVSGCEHLCLAGGVALNCVLNSALLNAGLFRDVWIQPAAGDAGTALGAALWIDSRAHEGRGRPFRMHTAYLGPAFQEDEIRSFLDNAKLTYRRPDDLIQEATAILASDKVVGWFQGRMEFGPRALGSRSILASPLHESMQARLNAIKDREDFRPVAPVVLEDAAPEWFSPPCPSPFMLFVNDIPAEKQKMIPAVRHVDGTARIQTINRNQNPLYYDLIRAFADLTGVPILVNTSFNTRGRPIVCTPRDAIECFMTSPIDVLVIGPFILEK